MLNLGNFEWTGGSGSGSGSTSGVPSTVSNITSAYQQVKGKNLGQFATGLAASFVASPVGPVIAVFLASLGFAKGKTERASGADATRIANELAPAIFKRILETATTEQKLFLSEHLPGRVMDYIRSQKFWRERSVDNIMTADAFHRTFLGYKPSYDIANPWRTEYSIWTLIHWAVKNSPKDLTLLQEHLQQIFSDTIGAEMQSAYQLTAGSDTSELFPKQAESPAGVSTGTKLVGTLALLGAVLGIVKGLK